MDREMERSSDWPTSRIAKRAPEKTKHTIYHKGSTSVIACGTTQTRRAKRRYALQKSFDLAEEWPDGTFVCFG